MDPLSTTVAVGAVISLPPVAAVAGAVAGPLLVPVVLSVVLLSAAGVQYLLKANTENPPMSAPTPCTAEEEEYPRPDWLQWKHQLNWAVIGRSGTGKSTFINSFRGLKPKDPEAAKVDVKECTKEPTPYTFPAEELKKIECVALREKLASVNLWDLPGAGTPNHPRETYIKDKGLRYFDGVVIMTEGRFTEIDLMLIVEMRKFEIPFFLVRSKADLDITNSANDDDCDLDELEPRESSQFAEKVVDTLKTDVNTNLENEGLPKMRGRIFVIGKVVVPPSKKPFFEILVKQFRDLSEAMMRDMYMGRSGRPLNWSTAGEKAAWIEDPDQKPRFEEMLKKQDCSSCKSMGKVKVHKVSRLESAELWLKYQNSKMEIRAKWGEGLPPMPASAGLPVPQDEKVNESYRTC
ncbi:Iigp1 [Symbiodinium sp. CCMP2592]|nr:Iigp1 [Symbiodinium sp. CCMP2592]